MQEISVLLKSLNELEFLVAYQKHIITSSKCTCDPFLDNLKEFYRLYVNMKHLAYSIKSGIWQLYNENLRLKEANDGLTDKLAEILETFDSENEKDQQVNQSVFRYDALIDHNQSSSLKSYYSNKKSSSQIELGSVKNPILIKPSPETTTIARAIEETELELARRRPFNYLHNTITTANKKSNDESTFVSSSSSFSSNSLKCQSKLKVSSLNQPRTIEFKPIHSPLTSTYSSLSSSNHPLNSNSSFAQNTANSDLVIYQKLFNQPRNKQPIYFKSFDNLNYSDYYNDLLKTKDLEMFNYYRTNERKVLKIKICSQIAEVFPLNFKYPNEFECYP